MEDLASALLLEQEIIINQGIEAACGCLKFVMCPFPETPWYYATLCRHDNDSGPRALTPGHERRYWWYDLHKQRMIYGVTFEEKHLERLRQQAEVGQGVFSFDPLNNFVYIHVREKLFHIARTGQVRRAHPSYGDWL